MLGRLGTVRKPTESESPQGGTIVRLPSAARDGYDRVLEAGSRVHCELVNFSAKTPGVSHALETLATPAAEIRLIAFWLIRDTGCLGMRAA